jgi:hypothetical protein
VSEARGSENRPKNEFSGANRLDYYFGDEVAGEPVVKARQWFKCYHCNHFQTDNEKDYESHNAINHYRLPAYPTIADLERHGLEPQGKSCEI